jgi:hypothetical protein
MACMSPRTGQPCKKNSAVQKLLNRLSINYSYQLLGYYCMHSKLKFMSVKIYIFCTTVLPLHYVKLVGLFDVLRGSTQFSNCTRCAAPNVEF